MPTTIKETVGQLIVKQEQIMFDLISERDELKKELELYKAKEQMLLSLLMKERGISVSSLLNNLMSKGKEQDE